MSRVPVTVEAIDAYASGTIEDPDAFEDALFDAAARGDTQAAEYFALRDGVRELVRRGTYDVVVTSAEAVAIERSGLRTTRIDAPLHADSGGGEVDTSADILLIRVELPLDDVSRLDVEMLAGTTLVKTIDDVRFDPREGAIYMACEGQLALATRGTGLRHRFVSIESAGRRVLREIGFDDVVEREP